MRLVYRIICYTLVTMHNNLHLYPSNQFSYRYLAGPMETKEALEAPITEGNCRMALQLYFYKIHGHFFTPEQMLFPFVYKKLGTFIFKEESIDIDELKPGDIIFAENIRNKEGELIEKGPDKFTHRDEWRLRLHTLIYIGKLSHEEEGHHIWHATYITGKPVIWTWDHLLTYYKPVTAKRVLD